jgi:hypothetical protein
LYRKVNPSYTPRWVWMGRASDAIARRLRAWGLHRAVRWVKKTDFRDLVRQANTADSTMPRPVDSERSELEQTFADSIRELEDILKKDLKTVWYDYRPYDSARAGR